MEPIWGLILFLAMCGIVALVANKKGRSGMIFFFASAAPALPLVMLVSFGFGNSETKGLPMAIAAFLCPIVGFIAAVMADNKEQVAARTGDFGDYKKCPFCAESVHKEAIKCKHCGSALSGGAAEGDARAA